MADKHDARKWAEISRREALRWIATAPVHLGLLSSGLAAALDQAAARRSVAGGIAPDSPIARGQFPRLLLTPAMLEALRGRIASDAAFKPRMQTAIAQIESKKSTWNSKPNDQYANAFAAFLTMVRRPDNDLGLAWSLPWQTYRDRILTAANRWSRTGRHSQNAIATALIYDCLYNDLTEAERRTFAEWVDLGYQENSWLSQGVEVWDNGKSDDHAAKLFCALVSTTAKDRVAEAYARTIEVAETNDWMGFGFGLGREWHEGYVSRHGLPVELYALKHAGGFSDDETIGHFLTHLRDAWQLTRHAIIPHPAAGVRNGAPWTSDKFHTQDPVKGFHRQSNVAAHMAWALVALPGKVRLDAVGMSDQPTLAKSEAHYFGYLRTVFDEAHPISGKKLRDIFDVTQLGRTPSNHQARFWAFPAWLIHNLQEHPPVSEADAGIPQVRRYWPGTLEWTFINSPDFGRDRGSVIRYTHRKYAASNYEEGTRQNGRWHVHRDGPLLIQRGETGHGVNTRRVSWSANGVVSFVDDQLYPLFTFTGRDNGDNAGIRDFRGGNTREQILAEPTADFGDVTSWHADQACVAITSDLTRSYNSSVVQYGPPPGNDRKISSFIREFVVVRRGGDGTDREKVFTYDRIALLDTRFEPRYNLCPAANPDIDGTETEVLPWGPDRDDPKFEWYAKGPTHWDYPGATRLVYDNAAEPGVRPAGKGKVCVTWLEPNGSRAKIRKAGGLNAVSKVAPRQSGHPFFSPWRGWQGKDEWAAVNGMDERAYVGLYTVTVAPATVSKDTRFLIACEVMAVGDTPSTSETVTCDEGSVAARCGASLVVFARDAGGHRAGRVNVPRGVTLVVFANLPPGQTRELTVSGDLTITSSNRTASPGTQGNGRKNNNGRLTVGVSGAGTLIFS